MEEQLTIQSLVSVTLLISYLIVTPGMHYVYSVQFGGSKSVVFLQPQKCYALEDFPLHGVMLVSGTIFEEGEWGFPHVPKNRKPNVVE